MLEEYRRIHLEMRKELEKKQNENSRLWDKFRVIKFDYERYKIVDKPNLFVRIFKPSVTKKYQESVLEYETLKEKYEQLKESVEQLETREELDKKIQKITDMLTRANDDIRIVINYYVENNIPIILTEEDKRKSMEEISNSYDKDNFFDDKRRIEKLEDVMLVHKTDYVPSNNEIGTRMSSYVIDHVNVMICGKKYDVNLRPRRDSVHFSVNHEVVPNNGGNWSNCKYIVVVPLVSIPKGKFASNNCVDTFTIGKVELTDQTYIICPKNEIDEVKRKNPNVMVLGYEGDSSLYYAETLLWMLGYSVEMGNDWGFDDTERQNSYHNMVLDAGYSSVTHHSKTMTKKVEEKRFYLSYIVGILETIMCNNELHNIDSLTIIEDIGMAGWFCYFDNDNYKLFNYYLSEIGMEPNYPEEGISPEFYMDYCKMLVDNAKELGKQKSLKL